MYAFAGPISMCVQEASAVSAKVFSMGRKPSSNSRRSFDPVHAATGPADSAGTIGVTRSASPNRRSAGASRQGGWSTGSMLWSLLEGMPYLGKHLPGTARGPESTATQAASHLGMTQVQPGISNSAGSAAAAQAPEEARQRRLSKDHSPQHTKHALLEDFVAGSDNTEISYASLLADLSDMAYDTGLVNPERLLELHQLHLVTTSCAPMYGPITREHWQAQLNEQRRSRSRSLSPASALLDPVASSWTQDTAKDAAPAPAAAKHNNDDTASAGSPMLTPSVSMVSLSSMDGDEEGEYTTQPATPTRRYPVLTFVPSPSRGPHGSHAQPQDGSSSMQDGQASPSLADQARMLDVAIPMASDHPPGSLAEVAASVTQVVLPVVAHEQLPSTEGEPLSSQAGALVSSTQPPAAWFACDDPVTKIRYLVIQGSTTLDHWQINLQFEPVIFEDPALGVRVHRGIYMAALKLYDDLLPVVRQHLATSPFASITFTGHSLGGSLATVLMLLMVHRGVLPPDSVSPTYTFGAPAVFCAGALPEDAPDRCTSCGLDCPQSHRAPSKASQTVRHCPRHRGLFAQLGLGEEHIVNVIMHRDIVPRAFVCDYTRVADLLMQWMPSFKSLSGLQGPAHAHKSLYSFLGRVTVLQPDTSCSFVNPADATHPLLPSAAGLYRMVAPAPKLRVHALHHSFDLPVPSPMFDADNALDYLSADESSATSLRFDRVRPYTPAPYRRDDGMLASMDEDAPGEPTNLKQAVLHFMNTPHPLTTLSEYAAYGPNGSISRYHNPRNYTLGLLSLIGKAPHQRPPRPSPDNLPSLDDTPCPVDMAAVRSAGMEGWQQDLTHLCAASRLTHRDDQAISPEALRLIKHDHHKHSSGSGDGRKPGSHAVVSRNGKSAGPQPSRRVQQKPAAAGPKLPSLPGLGSLLAAVGYTADN